MMDTKVMSNDLDEIMKALEEGVKDFMETDAYKSYLRAVGKFHNYSMNNVMLITMQRPDATLVAGYNTWKKSFNRNVKRGEKGLKIIAPMPVSVEKEEDRVDQYGNTYKEKVTVTVPRFRAVTVFDVSQTDGDPLPDISPAELKNEVNNYSAFLKAVEKASDVPINFIGIEGSAKGYFNVANNEISVAKGMSESQTLKTLIHEIAHSVLHNKDNGGVFIDTKTKEVQAESVAFSVCSHFGIDTSEYTFPYVTAWAGDKDLKTLRNSMDTIKDTASLLIHRIEDNYKALTQEKTEPAQHLQKGAER
ncbi:MAG: hypothetical protein IJF87_05455 [Erysipelotrichaceae bacterium]|nr:hypothetical protein [Erysipelotrichaceae bacterium]